MSTYGIMRVEYEQMLAQSSDKREICGTNLEKINIDHDCGTGCVRGLQCKPCNTALTAIERVPNRHGLATRYLQMTSHKEIQ